MRFKILFSISLFLVSILFSACTTIEMDGIQYLNVFSTALVERAVTEQEIKDGYTILASGADATPSFVAMLDAKRKDMARITFAVKAMNPPPDLEEFHQDATLALTFGDQAFRELFDDFENPTAEEVLMLRDYSRYMSSILDEYFYYIEIYSKIEKESL